MAKKDTVPTSMRLSEEADRLLDQIAAREGLSRTAVVEQAIRRLAEARGLR